MLPESLREFPVAAALNENHSSAITGGHAERGELTILIDPAAIVEVCRFLKNEQEFIRLSSITAVDWFPADPRFEVVYHLHSLNRKLRLRLKCPISETQGELDSVISVWRAADWYEREIFDLFGIRFRNHPNLKRLLLPEDWEGYPLRKDYPIHGYKYSYKDE